MVGNKNTKNKQNSFNHLQLAVFLARMLKTNEQSLLKWLILPAGLVNEKSLSIHTAAIVSSAFTYFHRRYKEDKHEKLPTIYIQFCSHTSSKNKALLFFFFTRKSYLRFEAKRCNYEKLSSSSVFITLTKKKEKNNNKNNNNWAK